MTEIDMSSKYCLKNIYRVIYLFTIIINYNLNKRMVIIVYTDIRYDYLNEYYLLLTHDGEAK